MNRLRKCSGQSVAEFGPALFVLFLLLFFPLLNLLGILTTYGCGWYFNFHETREMACRRHSDVRGLNGKSVHEEEFDRWKTTGFYAFMGGDNGPRIESQVDYDDAKTTLTNTSTVTAQPFLKMPMFAGVPGLGAPYTFTIATTRRQEETRD
jgi:hypothetical protein